MKTNLPLSGREYTVPPGEILVSQTNCRGVITYANSTFAEISGHTADELVGASHNIVRHPEVPAAVFKEMWATLRRGDIWQGVLLNRRKDGGHYWVDTVIVPQQEDGIVTGYLSVRRQARPEDIAAAERRFAHLRANDGGAERRTFRLDRWLSIRSGVVIAVAMATLLLAIGAAVGLDTMTRADRAMGRLQREALETSAMLARIKFLMADNRALVLDTASRQLGSPAERQHNATELSRRVGENRREIEETWRAWRLSGASPRLSELADDYWAARVRYALEGLQPAAEALVAGRIDDTHRLIRARLNPLYDDANAKADALMARLHTDASAAIQDERSHFRRVFSITLAALALVLGCLVAAGALFLRHVVRPIEERIGDLRRMSEGNLTARIDTGGGGEIGALNRAFASTQAQLQFLLDVLGRDATTVSAQSARLRLLAAHINDGIDEQHGRLWRIAERFAEARSLANCLATRTEGFMATCTRVSSGIECFAGETDNATSTTAAADDLEETALVVATDSRLLNLLTDELARDIERIAEFLVDHREATHGLWWSARKLGQAAANLESSTQRFNLG